jgi:FkbM family methyltransferase
MGAAELDLVLPLQYRQNWTILFDRWDASPDQIALRYFREYVPRSNCILDVGMNAGLYLYTAIGYRKPGATIVGFEPHPGLAGSVARNVHRNSLDDVEVIEASVSSDDGTAELLLTDSDCMGSLEQEFLAEQGRPVIERQTVQCRSLDSFAQERQIRIDLLKIDVEGHEPSVIAGARESIAFFHPTIFLEVADANIDDEDVGFLFELGYRWTALTSTPRRKLSRARDLRDHQQGGVGDYLLVHPTRAD